MRTLAYEARRLAGVRSTWIVLLATLAGAAVFTALTYRQDPSAALSAEQAARRITAVPSMLPLPFAAFGAGVLGTLCYVHELRYPALRTSLVVTGRRLRLLGAKLLVIGGVAVALVAATALVDAVVLHFAAPGGLGWSGLSHTQRLPLALLCSTVLAVAAGWVALLVCGLLRSTAAGLLALSAVGMLPAAVQPAVAALLRRAGAGHGPFGAASVASLAVLVSCVVLLLIVLVAVQSRRRTV
ncbi:hypothetical protein [Peterkaempfera bronchialis]|uniref:ABC transporter permease n=1 Tax=Peterkaempfera bronchialis TaxID=2126346 RepID=A0A345T1A1_9ACTN|nr:hypothetical protein [Peterkaempfera bronchialis]AXI79756.1 hypothetical protein C7M71_022480 [Peterkaempfera bronchialis]